MPKKVLSENNVMHYDENYYSDSKFPRNARGEGVGFKGEGKKGGVRQWVLAHASCHADLAKQLGIDPSRIAVTGVKPVTV